MADERVIRVKIDGSAAVGGGRIVELALAGIAGGAVALAGTLKTAVDRAVESQAALTRLNAIIGATGNFAKLSTRDMDAYANSLRLVSTYSDETIKGAMGTLAAFKAVKGDTFKRATQDVLDLASAMGTDLNDAAKKVGMALAGPENAARSLRAAGVVLTEGQKDLIKSLIDSGHAAQAQEVVLAALEARYRGTAAAMADTFGGKITRLKDAFDEFLESIGTGIISMPELENAMEAVVIMVNDAADGLKHWRSDIDLLFATWAVSITRSVTQVLNVLIGFVEQMQSMAGQMPRFMQKMLGTDSLGDAKAALESVKAFVQAAGRDAVKSFTDASLAARKEEDAVGRMATAARHGADDVEKLTKANKDLVLSGSAPGLMDFANSPKKAIFADPEVEAALERQRLAQEAIEKAWDDNTRKIIEDQKKFVAGWEKYVKEPGIRAWQSTKDAALDAFSVILSGGQVNFKQLFQSLLQMWIRTLAEMVVRWYAAQAAMKAAGAVNSNGSQPFSMSSMSGMFGGGGGAGGMSAGAAGALGIVAAFAAVYFGVSQWIKTHRKEEGEINLLAKGDHSGLWGSMGNSGSAGSGKTLDQLGHMATQINDLFRSLVKALGATSFELPDNLSIAIGATGRGKNKDNYVKLANGLVEHFGKDWQAAMEFATIQALKASNMHGLDPLVQAAIKSTMAKTVEEFNKQMAAIIEVSNVGQTQGETQTRTDFRAVTSHIDELYAALVSLQLPAAEAAQAFSNLAQMEINNLTSLRDAITGRQKTVEEEYQDRLAQARMFNAELALRKLDIQMKVSELESEFAMVKAHAGVGGAMRDIADGVIRTAINITEAAMMLSPAQALIQAQIDALLNLLNNLPKEINPDEIIKGGSRGRGGQSDGVKDFIKQKRYDLAEFGKGPYERAMDDLKKQYDEEIKAAGKNKKAIEDLLKLRDRETKLIQAQIRENVRADTKSYLQKGGDVGAAIIGAQSEAKKLADELKDAMKAGAIGATEMANKLAKIEAQAKAIQFQILGGAANDLLLSLYDYLGKTKEADELRHQLAVAELLLKQQELQAALAMANLTEQQRQQILATLGILAQLIPGIINDPNFGTGHGPAQQQNYGGGINQAQDSLASLIEEFQRAKKAIEDFRKSLRLDEHLSPLTPEQRLMEAQSQFQSLAQQALTGNVTAMQGIPQAAQAFLEIARSFFASSAGYQQIFDYVDSILQQILNLQNPGVPHLAAGGIVTRPMLALVGESGPEAVVPIGRAKQWHENQFGAAFGSGEGSAAEVRALRAEQADQAVRSEKQFAELAGELKRMNRLQESRRSTGQR